MPGRWDETREIRPARITDFAPHPSGPAWDAHRIQPVMVTQDAPILVETYRSPVGNALMVLAAVGFFLQSLASVVFLVAAYTIWRTLADLAAQMEQFGGGFGG